MRPRAKNRQPSGPAPGPSGAASITPSMLGMALALSQIAAKDLDRFIQDHLKPNPQFQKQVSKAIDVILGCLRENCVYKASRVSKVSRWVETLMGTSWGTARRRGRSGGPAGQVDICGRGVGCPQRYISECQLFKKF